MIEEIWERIRSCEGETFKQIKGGEFYYTIKSNQLHLSRTNRIISKGIIEQALVHVPFENTVPLQNLQAPSYIFAILMDKRIRKNDW
ncbi:hypothetical protein ACIFOT_27925 [Neobacillus sp. NRS-1170]|uniref:hypothetical protein n=1 Tax=Neobacillus sp. NRS-1170 TaxID=3233898 RepID=UPI003D29ADF2